ncbi:leucine-rich repeats and immunoglobulin-like domains protein 1 isoform X1 [Physeter macrocephalus]|uniref:leucine-rich repeats and immunoglobulin-like domains protein 1 isoform X1 n=1 Tax=Physeter macrocephalus TaxID=9755 RepID=UPI001058ADA0|nr:leucine-rich repeats and immunoglobulin-like domains protein 1 isoform X1 [Physeter catodon]|eukprot:XP_028335569.1 leucine-rich repeats and immunoglobulin-like domains protein 1 isoform X1 [Physeter catodon]
MARPVRRALGAPLRSPCLLLHWLLLVLVLLRLEPASAAAGRRAPCAAACTCAGDSLDCGGRGLAALPGDLPAWTRSLNLSYSKLSEIDPAGFEDLPNLQEVYLNNNELTAIPSLGAASSRILSLFLQHNRIRSVEGSQLKAYVSLEVLDLSSNNITEIRSTCFPHGLPIKELNLASNRISTLESGAFDGLSRSLLTLRLSKNRITQLPVKAFKLPRLTQLDLNRNRIRLIEGLTFQGLDSLEVLRLQRNNISKLTDGAFWGLARMQALHLEYNSLVEVNSGSLYGLTALHQLHLGNNSISRIHRDGWSFCQKLHELILSFNNLTRLDEESLADLSSLSILRLSHNSISHIAEGAFRGLKSLRVLSELPSPLALTGAKSSILSGPGPRPLGLRRGRCGGPRGKLERANPGQHGGLVARDLDHNEISGTIEDTSGAFTGLESLSKLTLSGNKIKSVAKRAFSGLEGLEHLNLGENAIRSVQFDAFVKMKNLKELHISSDGFLCDCQLKWLPPWLLGRMLQGFVTATCAHPESLKGQSIFAVPPESFVCDDVPKPQIITQPETTTAVVGKDVRFTCSAASSSSSPMTFAWKKDNEVLANADMENFAHVRAQDGEVMEYTTILHLRRVTFGHEGRYQCVITNHFGSTYSHKARLTVNVLPSFTKMPHDIAIRTGTMARLECAATGHPNPQIAWQKDGGTDFPAARERRMHVMPDDDVFFITDVKIDDMGVYSCTAQNSAGSISANATLTVLETPSLAVPLEDRVASVGETVALQCKATGSPPPRITWLKGDRPLILTERHHFTPGNQLLVVQNVVAEDAGRYTCEMSNALGTERAHSQLSVLPTPGCRKDGTTVGIFTIAVVCSIVLTSLVWVCIIYQTRKKSEEYSVTNTDETIVPPDVPSYLSSQGTLSDRQETMVRTEGGHQANGHIESNGVCPSDTGLFPEVEAHGITCRQPKLCIGHTKERWEAVEKADGTPGPQKRIEHGGPAVCGDCSTDAHSPSEEQPFCPQPVPRDSAQPGTRSGLEPSPSDRPRSPQRQSSGAADGSRSHCKGSLYPSNHDRMLAALKKPAAPLDGKGASSWTIARLCELDPSDLQPSCAFTPGKPELTEAASGFPDGPSEGQHLLLSNGHLPQACDFGSEATPVTGQPPGRRSAPLLFAPKS